MFVGVNLFGTDVLSTPTPPKEQLDRLSICSGTNKTITIDEINVLNIYSNQVQALALTAEQAFGVNTRMLAHLENTLEAGNISSSNLPVTSWRVLRRKVSETNYTLVAIITNASISNYTDAQIISGQEYEYAIQSDSNGTRGQIIAGGGTVVATISNWTISNLAGTVTYIIDTDVNSSAVKTNRRRSEIEVNSAFPIIYYGQPNYRKGSLTFKPKQLNSEGTDFIYSPRELIDEFDTFVNNEEVKVLRNSNGLAITCNTHDFSYKQSEKIHIHQDTTGGQLYDISFSFVQLGVVG